MPSNITWADVQKELETLHQAGVYPPLDSALEPIESLINSRQSTPDLVSHFIKKVREMNMTFDKTAKDERERKQSLRKVVEKAEADFDQSNWQVESVTNAHNVYNFVFDSVKKAVEEPKQSIPIPVVLLVMNRQEASELDSGKITVPMPANYVADLDTFKALLKPNWLKNYSATPEKWRPFDSLNQSISDLMTEMLTKVQQSKGYAKPLVPHFIGIHELNADRDVLKYLRLNGCFVINDVISMWHPEIQRHYRTTLLDAYPSTIVVRIAPLNQSNLALTAAQPLIAILDQFQDLEFFKRMDSDSDMKCTDLSASYDLRRYVMNYTPELIEPYDKLNSPLTRRIIGSSIR
jgi:hypothetical protein